MFMKSVKWVEHNYAFSSMVIIIVSISLRLWDTIIIAHRYLMPMLSFSNSTAKKLPIRESQTQDISPCDSQAERDNYMHHYTTEDHTLAITNFTESSNQAMYNIRDVTGRDSYHYTIKDCTVYWIRHNHFADISRARCTYVRSWDPYRSILLLYSVHCHRMIVHHCLASSTPCYRSIEPQCCSHN